MSEPVAMGLSTCGVLGASGVEVGVLEAAAPGPGVLAVLAMLLALELGALAL